MKLLLDWKFLSLLNFNTELNEISYQRLSVNAGTCIK